MQKHLKVFNILLMISAFVTISEYDSVRATSYVSDTELQMSTRILRVDHTSYISYRKEKIKRKEKKKKTKRQKRENNQLLNIMILSSVGLISSSDLLSIHLKYFISSLSYLTQENKRKQNSICHISWKKGRKSIKFSIPF